MLKSLDLSSTSLMRGAESCLEQLEKRTGCISARRMMLDRKADACIDCIERPADFDRAMTMGPCKSWTKTAALYYVRVTSSSGQASLEAAHLRAGLHALARGTPAGASLPEGGS
jgi:hypothetical protein